MDKMEVTQALCLALMGRTAREIAEATGLTEQTIYGLRRGASMPTMETAIALSRYLEISIDELVGEA